MLESLRNLRDLAFQRTIFQVQREAWRNGATQVIQVETQVENRTRGDDTKTEIHVRTTRLGCLLTVTRADGMILNVFSTRMLH
jgi:hypothetical protein